MTSYPFEILTTPRLFLRKLDPPALRHLFETCSGDELYRQLGTYTPESIAKELERNRKGYESFNRSMLNFQLIDKITNRVIGACGYHLWHLDHHRAEIGYAILLDDYKQKGLMSEAFKPILDYGFEKMKLNRIEALVGPGNIASQRLLEKNNFTREGYLKSHYLKNGVYEDSIIFALLKQ
jgi:ribosomal-protein-alanine N-acetyltransferase